MKHLLFAMALGSGLLAPSLSAQSAHPAQKITKCPTTQTLPDLTKALDAAVSGPVDRDRSCLRELLMPDAHMTPILKTKEGGFAPRSLTIDGWVDAVKKRGGAAFYERQAKVTAQTYGHIAHLWSTYEIRETPGGPLKVRGINSIEAVKDGDHWRILNIQWQAETPEEKVPKQYLP
jgi:hypothetical protein